MNDNSKCSTIECKCSTLAFIFQGYICAKHAQVLKNVSKFEKFHILLANKLEGGFGRQRAHLCVFYSEGIFVENTHRF